MKKIQVSIVAAIVLISLLIRLHNYDIYPQRGASSDEYTYAFLGVSLITKHIPISWSAFPEYKNRQNLTIKNLYFPIVYPYFDHPPLNGLLTGGWAVLNGEDTFPKIELKTVRLVPIFLSVLSSILVFLIALRLYNYKTAIWALLIYSTATSFVMNGRVVFAENLMTPLILGTIYLFSSFRKNMNLKKAIILGALCGLAFLTKILGVSIFLTILYLFLEEKIKTKYVITLCIIFLLFALSFVAYGKFYDMDLFWKIFFDQSGRETGPQSIWFLMSNPIIVNKVYYDGWYLFGILSIFFAFSDYVKNKLIIIPFFAYFTLLILSITGGNAMGSYMLPLFPFMAIASARLVTESLEKESWFVFVMLFFVGMPAIKYLYADTFGLTPMQFRILTLLMFGPFILLLLTRKNKWFKKLGNAWFYILILGSAVASYTYIHPA